MGTIMGVIKGDTGSLDYGSSNVIAAAARRLTAAFSYITRTTHPLPAATKPQPPNYVYSHRYMK